LFIGRPRGTKAAKEDHIQSIVHEGAICAQAEATKTMVAAQMRKA
jgi:hypothetical protein